LRGEKGGNEELEGSELLVGEEIGGEMFEK